MMTRDGERVIEVLLVTAALVIALGADAWRSGDPIRTPIHVAAHAVSVSATGLADRPTGEPDTRAAEAMVVARPATGPFPALGERIGRAVRDLASGGEPTSTARC